MSVLSFMLCMRWSKSLTESNISERVSTVKLIIGRSIKALHRSQKSYYSDEDYSRGLKRLKYRFKRLFLQCYRVQTLSEQLHRNKQGNQWCKLHQLKTNSNSAVKQLEERLSWFSLVLIWLLFNLVESDWWIYEVCCDKPGKGECRSWTHPWVMERLIKCLIK